MGGYPSSGTGTSAIAGKGIYLYQFNVVSSQDSSDTDQDKSVYLTIPQASTASEGGDASGNVPFQDWSSLLDTSPLSSDPAPRALENLLRVYDSNLLQLLGPTDAGTLTNSAWNYYNIGLNLYVDSAQSMNPGRFIHLFSPQDSDLARDKGLRNRWALQRSSIPGPCSIDGMPAPAAVCHVDDPNGWSLDYSVSETEGLVLNNVTLHSLTDPNAPVRYMADKISLPYCELETSAFPKQRFQLKPDSMDFSSRSRLKSFDQRDEGTTLVIEAVYMVYRIPQQAACR